MIEFKERVGVDILRNHPLIYNMSTPNRDLKGLMPCYIRKLFPALQVLWKNHLISLSWSLKQEEPATKKCILNLRLTE